MKKPRSTDYPVGSPQYVVDHALWRKSRGKKNPSLPFLYYENPLEALNKANDYIPPKTRVDYLKNTPLNLYVCDECGISNVKLWRENSVPIAVLFCAKCTAKKENIDIGSITSYGILRDANGKTTDWIGKFLPAIPTETETSESKIFFWRVDSIPKAGARWWWGLPTISPTKFVAGKKVRCVKTDYLDDLCGIDDENRWHVGDEFVVEEVKTFPYGTFLYNKEGHNLSVKRAILV